MIIEQILDKNNKMLSSYPFNPALGKLNTPYDLVYEMIEHIPEKLFISDDTKFLDPCTGTGTFIIEILRKLLKYKTFDIAIKQVYMCEISRPISNAFLLNILPKIKINIPVDNSYINEYFNLIIREISGGEKTFNDLYYIIHNEDIKNQLNEIKMKLNSFIEKYEKVSKLESKLFGEVFTPKNLIEEMLNIFPKEIWSNKNLKWLDPAVGIGNFPSIVFEKLMNGLKEEIPSDSERYKWIMEEMIYMVDISTKNLFLLYKLFDENNKLELNVYRGSFLESDFNIHMKNVWGLDGFDVILGNPPYNDGDKSEEANKLYPKFINESLILLNENGYLNMVTPTGWFTNTADIGKGKSGISILNEFKKYNLLYLNPNSDELKLKYFNGVGSTFCYFLLKKDKEYDGTIINNYNVDINKFESLPKYANELSFSINEKFILKNENLNTFTWIDQNHNLLNEESKIHSDKVCNKNYHTPAKGITWVYSTNVHPNKYDIKIIVSISGKYIPYIDNGEVGFSNMCMAIITDAENKNNIFNNLNNKLFKFMIENNKFSGFNPRKYILLLPKLDINIETDQDVYDYYNLTQQEIELIEKTIKD